MQGFTGNVVFTTLDFVRGPAIEFYGIFVLKTIKLEIDKII